MAPATPVGKSRSGLHVAQMNWFKTAFANEEFETKENAGLSRVKKPVTATNPANGKTVQIIPGQELR